MINFQEILFVIILISTIYILLSGEKRLQNGFFIATLLLATGYRQVFLSTNLQFQSAELLFWLLAVLLIFQRNKGRTQDKFRLPVWLSLFMVFWPIGWITVFLINQPIDFTINQFKPFLLLPVSFWLLWNLIKENGGFYTALRAMFLASTLVGVLGVFEYYFPGLAGSIPGFSANAYLRADYLGFTRAMFIFYGAPTATFMLVITVPLGLALWHQAASLRQKMFLIGGVAFQIMGIYIGGYRSMWLALGVEVIMLVMLYRGVFVGLIGMIPLVFIYQSLPSEALIRISTLYAAAGGHAVDSSAIKRIDRVSEAYGIVQQNPLGVGWGVSGWVHNDILQIAVQLGVAAVALFLFGYFMLAFKLAKKTLTLRNMRATAEFQVSLGLLLAFMGSGFLYASQGVTWLAFLALPAWIIWALAEYWVKEPSMIKLQEQPNATQNIRTTPRFQQRRYSPRDPRIDPLGGRDTRR